MRDGALAFTQALEIFSMHMNSNRSQICAECACATCRRICICVCRKNKKPGQSHLQKMSLTPITPTKPPVPLQYTTGQISHYEDEWVHKNTITYHSTCRIPRELLTELLIRAIGEEAQRLEFLAKKILDIRQISSWCILPRTHDQPSMWAHAKTHKHT